MTDARATTLEDLEASARVPRAQQLEVQVEPRLLDHPSARAVPPGDGGHDGDGD